MTLYSQLFSFKKLSAVTESGLSALVRRARRPWRLSSEERPSLRPAAVLVSEGSGQRGPSELPGVLSDPRVQTPGLCFWGALWVQSSAKTLDLPCDSSLAPVSSGLSQCGRGVPGISQVRALTPLGLAARAGCGAPTPPATAQLSAWPPPLSPAQPCSPGPPLAPPRPAVCWGSAPQAPWGSSPGAQCVLCQWASVSAYASS